MKSNQMKYVYALFSIVSRAIRAASIKNEWQNFGFGGVYVSLAFILLFVHNETKM